jgi:Uncharacterised nucleotidyltransferase
LRVSSLPLTDGLTALLRSESVKWTSLDVNLAEFLEACTDQDITGLIHQRLSRQDLSDEWPEDVRAAVAATAYADAATELIRGLEITSVLDALGQEGIEPVLLKGTALAYCVYPAPSSRPRQDTDLLIREEDILTVERAMSRLGYKPALQCDGVLLFCQFELYRTDDLGITHAFDFHWKISTQSVFADVLSYGELAATAEPIQALGRHARGPASWHALLLACIHPVMHHRNTERLIWMYDIHLLLARLQPADLDRFAAMAVEKGVAAVCQRQLALVHARFGTRVPSRVIASLSSRSAAEPSENYLRPERKWHHELTSVLRGMPDWRDRGRLLSEVLFPSRRYMLSAYGFRPGPPAFAVLPLLYVHRALRGGWNVLRGRK